MKTVIEMAREAGFPCIGDRPIIACGQEELERFAELVRADERERIYFQTSSDFVKAAIADEREACAKLCDARAAEYDGFSAEQNASEKLATAIRARSNT